ncbi:hypothetical protein F2Q69_00047995 [Brassica cretica]|uniref:DUF1985 domain-containing protein n=1 Tax=Brassica cretica TaxID=69181 RepID=A0A8S9PN07_BRACR|nr:hypothetical protein F2Q69_00047995 [Brassica cretica]
MVKNNYSGPVNACITMSAKRGRCEEDELADYTICMTIDQLPKTLFKQGTETQVEKFNNTCRTSILKKVEKYVEAYFVCKQLLTAKHHELWFHFARRALRFSMQEFHAITGLKYKDDEPDLDIDNWRGDKWFWSKFLRKKGKISLQQIRKVHLKSCNTWSHVDRLRMVYLCVIAGLVMVKDEKVCIPHKYIKLVMDFDKMRTFPSDLHSFDALVTTITEARDKVKTQNSYGVVSPYISSTGNGNIIVDAGFERDNEMNDERVDLIIDMYRKKYEWSKHVWGYQETVQPYAYSSEEDGSKEEEAGETSDCGMEEEIETAHLSPAKKRKNQYQDIGAESRKRLLCQRSTDKYRDLEEGMKSYIQVMFKSSFTALGLEVRDLIEDRFTKLEQTILSSQTQIGVPAYTQTHGAAPAYTPTPAAATTSTQ